MEQAFVCRSAKGHDGKVPCLLGRHDQREASTIPTRVGIDQAILEVDHDAAKTLLVMPAVLDDLITA